MSASGSPESPEDHKGGAPPDVGSATGAPPGLPKGGQPATLVDRMHILRRREKAVELYAMGYSYSAVAAALKVSWVTAHTDVNKHLEHTAQYWSATKQREQIAATLRKTIKRADEIHRQLANRRDLESVDMKLKALASIHRASLALMRLYGMAGDNVFLGDVHVTPGEGLLGSSPEWAKDMDPERVKEMRKVIIDSYKALQAQNGEVVQAKFTVEGEPPAEPASDQVDGAA